VLYSPEYLEDAFIVGIDQDDVADAIPAKVADVI
jgi:hypothetical protein